MKVCNSDFHCVLSQHHRGYAEFLLLFFYKTQFTMLRHAGFWLRIGVGVLNLLVFISRSYINTAPVSERKMRAARVRERLLVCQRFMLRAEGEKPPLLWDICPHLFFTFCSFLCWNNCTNQLYSKSNRNWLNIITVPSKQKHVFHLMMV